MNSTEPGLPVIGPMVTGPLIVGVTLNWYLYGVLTMQYYIYLTHAHRDKRFLRWIVHFLFLVDTAQTFMSLSDIFFWFVYNFGNYAKMAELNLSAVNGPLMDGLVAFTVQLVYCWRVWVLGGWRVVPAIAAFLAFVALSNGIVITVHDLIIKTVPKIKPVWRVTDYLWLLCSAGADLLLAGSMAYLLLKFRRSTYTSKSTAQIIKRVLLFSLETNAVTAVFATVTALFFLIKPIAPPNTNIYQAGGYILGKAYNNCFMVLLNQRLAYEARSRNTTEDLGSHSGPRAWNQHSGPSADSRSQEPQNQAEVEVSVIQFRDPGKSLETMEMSTWTKDNARELV